MLSKEALNRFKRYKIYGLHVQQDINTIKHSLDKLQRIEEVVRFGMEGNPDVPQLYVKQIYQILKEEMQC
jgi:hypothetical protein